jgi:hypothetical protein
VKPEDAIERMIPPSKKRPGKPMGGVIQIHVTRACNLACFNCTQGSQLRGPYSFMPIDLFEKAVLSLKNYFGIVGLFGGNPALHPEFESLCEILRKHIPKQRLGLWCNDPMNASKGAAMRQTFNTAVSNLNVHLRQDAFDRFREFWPEARAFGLGEDSRHSPVHGSMLDLDMTDEERWEKIAKCPINQDWSAGIGLFRGELRAWFCEIAMAQSILNEGNADYPDTGLDPTATYFKNEGGRDIGPLCWWELPMSTFQHQVKQHCLNCLVPMQGYGSLAQAAETEGVEVTTEAYRAVYLPKRKDRHVQFVELQSDLQSKGLRFTKYIQGAKQ